MQTSADMKKPSRLRRCTARLALFVAAAASAASCTPPSKQLNFLTSRTGMLTLRTEAPVATRHFRVRVSADRAFSESIDLRFQGELTSSWTPDDPSEQRKPVIRGRFNGFSSDWSAPAGFGIRNDISRAIIQGSRDDACDFKQAACEWLVPLDLEVQPKNTTGAVYVQWVVEVRASVILPKDEDLPGFALQVTEE